MMKKHGQNSKWPYLAILVCLFALSVAAPRHWRNLTRNTEPTLALPQPSLLPEKSDDTTTTQPPAVELSALVKSPQSEPTAQPPAGPQLVSPAEGITHLQTIEPLPRSNHAAAAQPLLVQPPLVHSAVTPPPAAQPAAKDPGGDVASQIAPVLLLPQCSALIERLERIDVDGGYSLWAREVIELLDQLAMLEADDRETVDEVLQNIRNVVASVDDLIKGTNVKVTNVKVTNVKVTNVKGTNVKGTNVKGAVIKDTVIKDISGQDAAMQLRHARYALVRRLDLWQQARAVESTADEPISPTATEVGRAITKSVDEVGRAASRTTIGSSWKRYLMLDELRSLAKDLGQRDVARRRQVARRVLARLESPGLDATQRRFAESGPVQSLRAHLQHWAVESVDSGRLLADIEQFERAGRSDVARRVAQSYQRLRFSPLPAERDLAKRIEMHYRNANIRLAVTDRFLNLMLPHIKPKLTAVNDHVLGNPVRGRMVTTTKLRTRLIPHPRRLRFALEAHGEIHSRTTASNSQATLHNRGISRYRAGKLLQVGPRGMRMWPALAEVESDSELESVETEYDGIPLISSFARSYARDQHEQMRAEAMDEVDRKIRRRATRSLDAAVDGQIKKFRTALSTHILQPLTHLSLKPRPVQLLTTADRMVSRVRVATAHQLAAYTPRPRAPGDSLLSLQIHESVPGNIIEQLALDGRTFTLRKLREWISKKTGRADRPTPLELEEELPEDVTITFAQRDAVRIRFKDGHVEIVLHVKHLETANRRMKNFVVKAIYEPHSEGVDAMLVRRDGLSLSSTRRINMRGQIVLRGIFAKVFSKHRPMHLLGQQLSSKPNLNSVGVTQWVIHEGWLGIAIGPRRPENVKPRPVVARNTK